MKKVIRKIVVDGVPCFWRVTEHGDYWDEACIRFWFQEGKNIPAFEVVRACNRSWVLFSDIAAGRVEGEDLGAGAVTPREVAELARVIIHDFQLSSDHRKTLKFQMERDGTLVLQQDNA